MKLVWYDPKADNPPWIEALADVRRMGTLEGYCFHHVQAIMLAIDQYAETALVAASFNCLRGGAPSLVRSMRLPLWFRRGREHRSGKGRQRVLVEVSDLCSHPIAFAVNGSVAVLSTSTARW